MKGHRVAWYVFTCALVLGVALAARAQDPSKVSPKSFTEKLNNDQVQVFEYHSNPGDKEPMHSHRQNIVYIVQGGKERFTLPDGKTQEREFKTGEVLWRDPVTHSVENIGTTEMRALIVELKGPAEKKP
jgi:quercetin dioxygenase-like cupin family protein